MFCFGLLLTRGRGSNGLGETVNKSVGEPAHDICKALENTNAAGLVASLEVNQVSATERRWRGNSRKSAVIWDLRNQEYWCKHTTKLYEGVKESS